MNQLLTIGRIVRYKVKAYDSPVLLGSGIGTVLPAIITAVRDPSEKWVNLQVFSDTHGGTLEWIENVAPGTSNGCWSWPPIEAEKPGGASL